MKKLINIAKNIFMLRIKENKLLAITDFLQTIFSSLIPLVSIYFSSKIVDSIIRVDQIKVKETIIISLLVSFAVMLGANALFSVVNYLSDILFRRIDKNYMDSFNAKDFYKIDSQEHIESFAQIKGMEKYMGISVEFFFAYLMNFINSLVSLVLAFIMFVGVFNKKMPLTSKFKFLDSPFIVLAFVCMLVISSILASKADNSIANFFIDIAKNATLSNSIWRFYAFSLSEEKRSLDIRLFKQDEKLGKMFSKKYNLFNVGGTVDKFYKTKALLINSLSVLADKVKFFMILSFVILKAYEKAISPGEFARYLGALLLFSTSVSEAISSFMRFTERAKYGSELIDFLDAENSIYKGSLTTEKRSDRKYEIEFKNVSFKYNDDQDWVLRNVNLRFNLGKRLAIVGENGSGKSTFIKLLIRLYDPQEGQILLNGIDIKKYRYEDYLKIFSVVFQDFKLFAYPLGENIAGSNEYDEQRVLNAINDVGLDDRISSMKDGLDTFLYRDIDEEGVMVSGGEAQKIAIARALYQDSPYIILDEPTAALDPLAEQEIYQKLSDIIKDRTAIFISHRLSSCKFADEIVVFDKGQIIENASHTSLLDSSGKYKELWYAQANYYI